MKNKLLLVSIIVFALGFLCICGKAVSPEYIDQNGMLVESFYLLPIGFFLMFSGLVLFIIYIKKRK